MTLRSCGKAHSAAKIADDLLDRGHQRSRWARPVVRSIDAVAQATLRVRRPARRNLADRRDPQIRVAARLILPIWSPAVVGALSITPSTTMYCLRTHIVDEG